MAACSRTRYSNTGSNWFLKIVALQTFIRADGSSASPGTLLVNGSAGGFSLPWDKTNFGWAGSKAVVAKGPGFSGATSALLYVACPASAGGAVYSVAESVIPGQLDWDFLSSPCGWMVALMPRVSGGSTAPFIVAVSTRIAQNVGFKQGNVPRSVSVNNTTATITTQHRSAFGVAIGGIPGSPIYIDDPDCTFVAGRRRRSCRSDEGRVRCSRRPAASCRSDNRRRVSSRPARAAGCRCRTSIRSAGRIRANHTGAWSRRRSRRTGKCRNRGIRPRPAFRSFRTGSRTARSETSTSPHRTSDENASIHDQRAESDGRGAPSSASRSNRILSPD